METQLKLLAWHNDTHAIYEVKKVNLVYKMASLTDYSLFHKERTVGFEDVVFMKFTGHLDIDGNEIFSGHLIECVGEVWQVCYGEFEIVYRVGKEEIITQNMGFYLRDQYESNAELVSTLSNGCKIVGNVFENKNLEEK